MRLSHPFPLILTLVLLIMVVLAVRSCQQVEAKRKAALLTETGRRAIDVAIKTESSPAGSAFQQPSRLLGETILRDYANPNLPPENDLNLIARLMDNFTLLVKSAADRPLSANEDWAAAFRGMNPAQERFLPDQHVVLNAQGQLIDRWGTPLFFHALGGKRFEIRSAGVDKKLWTEDDIHRNADGSFRHGVDLSAPSLLDAAGTRSR